MYLMLHIVFIKLLNESRNQVRIWLLLCTSQVATQGAAGCIRVGMLSQICDLTVHVCILQSLTQRNAWRLRFRPSPVAVSARSPRVCHHQDLCGPSAPWAPATCIPAPLVCWCRQLWVQGGCYWGAGLPPVQVPVRHGGVRRMVQPVGQGKRLLFLAGQLPRPRPHISSWVGSSRRSDLVPWAVLSNGPMPISGRDPLWGKAEEAESL